MYRKILAQNRIMLSAAIGFAVIGTALSLYLRNFAWLERFGSLVTCVGVLLLSRPTFVRQDILPDVAMAETGLSGCDPEHYRRMGVPTPGEVVEDQKSRKAVYEFGPWIIGIGTVIWGFGSLLNYPFGFAG